MNDRPTINTPVGQFDLVVWAGRNTSGIQPFGDRVLILPDQASGQIGSVYVPPEVIERVAEAAETGVLVAAGDAAWAWNSDRTRRYEGTKPVPGTRVYFERYAGAKHKGRDGLLYRLLDDKSIGGFAVEPEGDPVEVAGPSTAVTESHKLQEALARESDRQYTITDPSKGTLSGY